MNYQQLAIEGGKREGRREIARPSHLRGECGLQWEQVLSFPKRPVYPV